MPSTLLSMPSTSDSGTAPLVAVAMSGGVDSSVAALLARRAGYRALGLTMKLWSPPGEEESCDILGEGPDPEKTCCTADSALDARRVCDRIGIPHFTLDMREDFAERVIRPFEDAYLAGETPNPCVNCNSFVKWDALWRRAKALGADYVATGHYARAATLDGRTYILRGGDHGKDQSYFLWGIPPETLSRTLFPLADLPKPEVRRLAAEAGLRTARKKESMDICFVPKGDYREVIRERARRDGLAILPGPIRGPLGEVLGEHQGLPFYTIGQRKGLGVAYSEPLFVRKLDTATNTLVLGRREDLDCPGFRGDRLNLFAPLAEGESMGCLVQYRHRSPAKRGRIRNDGNGWVTVTLEEPGYCVSPGQSAAFYDGERLLGGARIRETG
ncbi:MAG TPA: tRNA 2-thiouridine(34) synthase MnmA [Fibrobacteria bacterium]|nr:tRNA 2-thiouridine(34) synthase MnmA [Fibrobacteria bacterium]